jgi:hypothetical protein
MQVVTPGLPGLSKYLRMSEAAKGLGYWGACGGGMP